jgi:regulatory protein YycH of two-component signal transduction system YycFG
MKQYPLKDKCLRPHTKLKIQKTEHSHNIKKKINKNHLVKTKADMGNTEVTLYGDDYNKKIDKFIIQNDFTKLSHDMPITVAAHRYRPCDRLIPCPRSPTNCA